MSNCNVLSGRETVPRIPYWPIAVLPLAAWLLSIQLPAWGAMWASTVGIFFGFKLLTVVDLVNGTPRAPNANQILGYVFAWPGLDAKAFFSASGAVVRPSWREWFAAIAKTFFGLWLWFGLARQVYSISPYWAGWVAMTGFILALHCGLFHGLSCFWRYMGYDAQPIMDWPILARSLSDFWGRRWNRAFRDVAYRFVLRPLRTRYGLPWATFAVFAVSGLVHDLVISYSARGGYGLPTMYFLLQCCAIWFEKSRLGRRMGLASGIRGRLFTLIVVGGGALFLFHSPFVHRVVLPMLEATGAL